MSKRAFILAITLTLLMLIFTLGMAFVSASGTYYREASRQAQAVQSRALAEAGIADAMAKIQRDILFPPPQAVDQKDYSYTEQLQDVGSAAMVGNYTVTIDTTYKGAPYHVILLRSTGFFKNSKGVVETTVVVELDATPPQDPGPRAGNYLQILSRREE